VQVQRIKRLIDGHDHRDHSRRMCQRVWICQIFAPTKYDRTGHPATPMCLLLARFTPVSGPTDLLNGWNHVMRQPPLSSCNYPTAYVRALPIMALTALEGSQLFHHDPYRCRHHRTVVGNMRPVTEHKLQRVWPGRQRQHRLGLAAAEVAMLRPRHPAPRPIS